MLDVSRQAKSAGSSATGDDPEAPQSLQYLGEG